MKPILFIDFDGTLCHDKFWKNINRENFEKIQNFLFNSNKSIVQDWMRGSYSSEEINQLVSKELDIPQDDLWKSFVSGCRNMAVSKENLRLLSKLKRNWQTILVTDNTDSFTRFTIPSKKLDTFFDEIFNSYESKKLKEDNNGQIFADLASRKGADISDSLLVDDSKIVCDLFSKLGGESYLVTKEATLSYYLRNLKDKVSESN